MHVEMKDERSNNNNRPTREGEPKKMREKNGNANLLLTYLNKFGTYRTTEQTIAGQ